MSEEQLPDQQNRDLIQTALDTNMLVEAGAGSGKTTALLHRMVALIRRGHARIDEIAAVTFTRKAASELRERFQNELELALTKARKRDDSVAVTRLDAALAEIDRGFIGTIHSFCARLLRERPVDAGLDPFFHELHGPEETRLRKDAWLRHLERLAASADPALEELAKVNVKPTELFEAFELLANHPDVDFPAPVAPRPSTEHLKSALKDLLSQASQLMPARVPDKGWDELQSRIRRLNFSLYVLGWDNDAHFFDALATIIGRSLRIVQKRWGTDDESKQQAKNLRNQFLGFTRENGPAHAALMQWYEHRYPIALRFAARAADTYEAERHRTSQLNFNDLLTLAARLLRESPSARRDLHDRYKFLLVDEFQDTDPLQAEIIFLLTADDPEEKNWHHARPRDGALFVVGDPKQSIYRFRRGEIAIYNQVRARFHQFGKLINLTANFRSHPPIETFLNHVFRELLPQEASLHQAAFAPLNTQKSDADEQGVFWYDVGNHPNAAAVAAADAELLASWIDQRISPDQCKAGDFLVLTYRKRYLSYYARALERRNIPVQVTGAGINIAAELHELTLLLRALLEPDNPVLSLAVLVGLFFGLDYEQLAAHKLADGKLSFVCSVTEPVSPVEKALARLHRWWRLTRQLPADVAIASIVTELGLLPYAAGCDLGESAVGSLLYALQATASAGLSGDSSLAGALEALEEALEEEEAEAPLQPGRNDVVRVMNLHKAKGLEAPVVVLAHPTGLPEHTPSQHIQHLQTGAAEGHFLIQHQEPWERQSTLLARPMDWQRFESLEKPFLEAEATRLLYVAATRAERELVISFSSKAETSPWRTFYDYFDEHCEELNLEPVPAPQRRQLAHTATEILEEVEDVGRRRLESAAERYRISSVSTRVKPDDKRLFASDGGRGASWGNAVHQALEAAGRGVGSERLRALCRTLLLKNDLDTDESGEPVDLEELVSLVESVRASPTWKRAQRADRALFEAPFSVLVPATRSVDEPAEIIEGIIDLAFCEPDGWVIVDYKTDVVEDAKLLQRRLEIYRDQVDLYAACWQGLTGERVKERRILLLGHGRDEIW
ncbi:MAG: UvrD-helicase domain-containing protein [Acidobacteriota bacterium]